MSQIDFNKEYARAQQRTRARREIAKSVASLAPEDARMVLLDVYLDHAAQETPIRTTKMRPRAQPRGRKPDNLSLTSRLLTMLGERPRSPIFEFAQELYGSNSRRAQGKTRSLLAVLKANGYANNFTEGAWELTADGIAATSKRSVSNPPLQYRILPTNNPYVHDETLPPQDGAEWATDAAARAAVATLPNPLQ